MLPSPAHSTPQAHPAPHHPPPQADFDRELAALLAFAQQGLDHALAMPRWIALTLLCLALALLVLGRQGQRLLAGVTLSSAVIAFAILFLRPQAPDAAWPGLVAVIGGGAALGLGLGVPGWTTALISSVSFGAIGAFIAIHWAEAPWLAGALPLALLGLFLGLANHLWWGLWMPPIAAAFFITLGTARLLGTSQSGPASMPQLTHADWAVGMFGVLATTFLAVSLERDHLRKKRLAMKTKAQADQELAEKTRLARERHAKYTGSKYTT